MGMNLDAIVLIILALTLVIVSVSLLLGARTGAKPKLKISFADGSTVATHKRGEEVTLALHIKNRGNPWPLPSPVVRGLTIWAYVSRPIGLLEMKWQTGSFTSALEAPEGGIFKGMTYIGGATDKAIFRREVESIDLRLKLPQNTGQYEIKIPIFSEEGDLGITTLHVSCV